MRDAGFRRFEIGILIYGLGFMCIQPVFARLFDQELHMNYSDASLAKGVVTNLAMIASIGWAGRMLHKIGLERLAMLSYVTLLGFAGLMVFAATSAARSRPTRAKNRSRSARSPLSVWSLEPAAKRSTPRECW